jgi:hypothetical protein
MHYNAKGSMNWLSLSTTFREECSGIVISHLLYLYQGLVIKQSSDIEHADIQLV